MGDQSLPLIATLWRVLYGTNNYYRNGGCNGNDFLVVQDFKEEGAVTVADVRALFQGKGQMP
ncbi:MAG: hypothetical protein JXB09_02040 [Deltaproteobacteria bacterium]|nr:hypothetical protein [Deltaproteobacteria bacterium]